MQILLGLIIGILITYILLYSRLKQTHYLNEDIQQRNKIAYNTYQKLTDDILEAKTELANAQIQASQEVGKLNNIQSQIEILSEQMEKEKISNIEAAENLKLLAMNQMQNSFEAAAEKERIEYQKKIEAYRAEFLNTMKDCTATFHSNLDELNNDYINLLAKFSDLEAKTAAAVEASKREQEKKDNQNFYKLTLSEEDVEEIKKLREVSQFLRDSEPLNKVIYKVYYEKPLTDLIGRVVGKTTKTGIYKITNLENNMCYIGQAICVASRWKQHIKRGVGAETPTHNKLYPAMYKIGVENFSFEIIEECSREQLNEREQFWQNYFKAKEFGYSIK